MYLLFYKAFNICFPLQLFFFLDYYVKAHQDLEDARYYDITIGIWHISKVLS